MPPSTKNGDAIFCIILVIIKVCFFNERNFDYPNKLHTLRSIIPASKDMMLILNSMPINFRLHLALQDKSLKKFDLEKKSSLNNE